MHLLKNLFLPLLLISLLSTTLVNCKKISNREDLKVRTAKLYITTLDQRSLLEEIPIDRENPLPIHVTINVDTTKLFQEMDGFGYTLTGGSALHLQKMSEAARLQLLQELFGVDSNAIGVSYLRVSVGASDLDEKPWSYNDLPEGETDMELEKFSLGYDTLYLIPTLKEIIKISPNIKIMGSPWSPPKWMKDNNDTRGGSLKKEYHGVYANYLLKYILAMQKEGITIDALTVQNEPLHPGNNPSLLMLEDQQAEFIKNSLGPVFNDHNIKTKISHYHFR